MRGRSVSDSTIGCGKWGILSSLSLSLSFFLCLFVCFSLSLSLSTHPSIYLSIYPNVCLSVYLKICLCIYLFVYPAYLPISSSPCALPSILFISIYSSFLSFLFFQFLFFLPLCDDQWCAGQQDRLERAKAPPLLSETILLVPEKTRWCSQTGQQGGAPENEISLLLLPPPPLRADGRDHTITNGGRAWEKNQWKRASEQERGLIYARLK